MAEIDYKPLAEEIDRILQDFTDNMGTGDGLVIKNDELEALYNAFDSKCTAHLKCHVAGMVSECLAIKLAFIMGCIVTEKRMNFKKEIVELYNLYHKE